MEILSAKNKSLEKSSKKIDLFNNTESINNNKNCIISLRINTLLYDTLYNYLLTNNIFPLIKVKRVYNIQNIPLFLKKKIKNL